MKLNKHLSLSRVLNALSTDRRLATAAALFSVLLLYLVQGIAQTSLATETQLTGTVTYYHTNLQRTPIAGTTEGGDVLWFFANLAALVFPFFLSNSVIGELFQVFSLFIDQSTPGGCQ